MAYEKRATAEKYKVKAGDDLAAIASAHGSTPQELSLFNWGTTDRAAVNRALFELVGCPWNAIVRADAYKTPFDGLEVARGGTGEVLIPKAWKADGLATTKRHTFKARRTLPCVAVTITKLDRWFIPGPTAKDGQVCALEYALEGIEARADKVVLEVRGSNYSNAAVAADGSVTWTPVDVPVWTDARKPEQAKPAHTYSVHDWSGQSTATDGALKPRPKQHRYINVAFSPYTVLARYFKDAADKDARLDLEPFWPRWDVTVKPPKLVPESLKIEWRVTKCTKLKAGQLVVVDKTGAVVFRVALKAGNFIQALAKENHSFLWDGKLHDGKEITPEGMPYRVEVEAHTDMNEANGVALAAMHTEVRLCVPPDTGKHKGPDAFKDPNALEFDVAPFVTVVPTAAGDNKWVQYTLARAGFHPGPVDGNVVSAETKIAMQEFQRSYAKNNAAPFLRLDPTGSKDADTVAALGHLASEARPLFGDPAGEADLKRSDHTLHTLLNKPASEVIVWVDDRHVYTDAGADVLPNPKMGLGNYRGAFDIGDAKVTKDASSIPRPWIPLQATPEILGHAQDLSAAAGHKVSDETRAALGPLRVDWTFDEPPEDLAVVDSAYYNKAETRTRRWIDEVKTSNGVVANGLTWRNCPELQGGIRPADIAGYYKVPFGLDAQSLEPWKALDDAAEKSVCTVLHDDLGQAEDKVFATHRGRAGVYFRPSRIAGDGYRVRAAVGFKKLPGGAGDFPNREVLARRYPVSPQAHTAALRVWHKTSFRGYLCWGPLTLKKWSTHEAASARLYRGARLHFVREPSPVAASMEHDDVTVFYTQALYKSVITTAVTSAPYSTYAASITMNAQHVWPYATLPGLGVPTLATTWSAADPAKVLRDWTDNTLEDLLNKTWRRYRAPLLFNIIDAIERTEGRMRGHFLVEFQDTPVAYVVEYDCDTCNFARVEVTNNVAATPSFLRGAGTGGADIYVPSHGIACPKPSCVGHLQYKNLQLQTLNFPAVGVACGGAWLFDAPPSVWAHEMGHHRGMEHAQSWPSKTRHADLATTAPGAKNLQHDAAMNPAKVAAAAPARDSAWDLCCIMSYNYDSATSKLYFCGKCVLKQRGWKAETLTNPAGALSDPP